MLEKSHNIGLKLFLNLVILMYNSQSNYGVDNKKRAIRARSYWCADDA